MIRKLTLSLGLGLLVGIFPGPAYAESITVDNFATLIFPDGSSVTDLYYVPPGPTATGFYQVDFQFQGGFGYARGDYNDGGWGLITFTTPVSNLSIDWLAGGAYFYAVASNADGTAGSVFSCDFSPAANCDAGSASFSGFYGTGGPTDPAPISELLWQAGNGLGGPTSISYTVDNINAPEPGSLLLLVSGLFCILGLFRRGFSVSS